MAEAAAASLVVADQQPRPAKVPLVAGNSPRAIVPTDRKSTRLNSSHTVISYAVFCLKKKTDRVCQHEHGDLLSPQTRREINAAMATAIGVFDDDESDW